MSFYMTMPYHTKNPLLEHLSQNNSTNHLPLIIFVIMVPWHVFSKMAGQRANTLIFLA
ncbi:hypothetical protein NMG60_11019306 [Bertholletia excelsa]